MALLISYIYVWNNLNLNKMLTPEELLKPRYKVIANYPDCDKHKIFVGKIIGFDYTDESSSQWYNDDGRSKIYDAFYEQYPHIFTKLYWWEERKEVEMPKYLQSKNGRIWEVDIYDRCNVHVYLKAFTGSLSYTNDFIPSTEEEYNRYVLQQKQ